MRISKTICLSALALGIGVTSASALTVEEAKKQGFIRAATANEVPYSYMQPDGTSAGIGPDVANAVLNSMGIEEVNWTVTPFGTLIPGHGDPMTHADFRLWKTAYSNLLDCTRGKADKQVCIAGWQRDAARFIDAAHRDYVGAALDYYIDRRFRAPDEQARYCKPLG